MGMPGKLQVKEAGGFFVDKGPVFEQYGEVFLPMFFQQVCLLRKLPTRWVVHPDQCDGLFYGNAFVAKYGKSAAR